MSTVSLSQTFALAFQHHAAGRLGEAEALYRQVLAAEPGHSEALHHLGVIAHQAGRPDLAIEWIRRAIALGPGNAAAHSNLGEACRATGRLDEAIGSFRRALELQPGSPDIHHNLGNAVRDRGDLSEAVVSYRRALALKPGMPGTHHNLAATLAAQGQLDEAVAEYQRALQLQPANPETLNNLGTVLRDLGRVEEGIASLRRALELRPDYPEALNNLGNALRQSGHLDEAVAVYRRALALKPDAAEACHNLAVALTDGDQLDEAVAIYRRASELKPNDSEIQLNLGNVLRELGRVEEAVAAYRRTTELMPEQPAAQSNVIHALHFHPEENEGVLAEEQRAWNRRFGNPVKGSIQPHTNDRDPARRLRIGYVSPDFRQHVIGRNLVPLFRCHDRRNFEILCYSGVVKPDALTHQFRECADRWRHTVDVGDEALAEMIRQDGVDILVDLSHHLSGNRLPMFARQPAPVQVSFAGYPEATGLDAIPYRISDRYLEPDSEDESSGICFIDSFWCYAPCADELAVNALPAQANGTVTFGSMNHFSKVNARALKLWARVLGGVPGSRLILLSHPGSHRQPVLEILARGGVAPDRVEFVELRPHRQYLELHHRLDIVLDPFPYNGHTTSLDALWMGVPVVSLTGRPAVSRAGYSQLSNLGLPEFAAFSEDDYVRIAVQLSGDLPRLAELRATLRARMEASVLMDAPRFARGIETVYRTLWQRWCARKGLG